MAKATGPTRGPRPQHALRLALRGGHACRRSSRCSGDMVPILAGAVLAERMKGGATVALTWIGDGGTSTGAFHEGFNFACVQKAPLVRDRGEQQVGLLDAHPQADGQHRASWTAPRAYGCFGEQVDGNDVLAVYEVTRRAIERARDGAGPDPDRGRHHAHARPRRARRHEVRPAGDAGGVGEEGPHRSATSAGCSAAAWPPRTELRRRSWPSSSAELQAGPGLGGGRARCPTPDTGLRRRLRRPRGRGPRSRRWCAEWERRAKEQRR